MRIPDKMRALVLEQAGLPLKEMEVPVPEQSSEDVLVRVHACAVCRTDLHVVDGELPDPKLPLIPGHQIVGTVVRTGQAVRLLKAGDRVGVPWLGSTCGECRFCRAGRENLCDRALFTGYTRDGGYAEYASADQRYCFPVPAEGDEVAIAPLLCAGLIGYRCYRMIGENVARLGIYGFGAAAHIVTQIAVHHGKRIFAFTSPGDLEAQNFARQLGAVWAGESTALPPEELDAAIIFAPVGALVPAALRATAKGGTVVCGGIHMSDIPAFKYELLWGERVLRSVANLTRADGEQLLALAPKVPVKTVVQVFPLSKANEALDCLRSGRLQGAAVLRVVEP
jgi:propanol-preferring alcohol dehydrogenase